MIPGKQQPSRPQAVDHIAGVVATQEAPQTASLGQFGDAKQEKRLSAVAQDAPSRLKLFQRIYRGTASPRECIKAFCLECVWMDEAAIRECTATACPLHRLRPYQRRPS